MRGSRTLLLAVLTPLLLLATLPWVIRGSSAVDCNTAGLTQWLPDRHEQRSRYEAFLATFGSDDYVLVSWTDCTLDDPRLTTFRERVMRLAGPDANPAKQRYFERITTGGDLLEQLTASPISLSKEEAARRLSGVLLGPDGRATAAMIRLTQLGRDNQRPAIELVTRIAIDECGLPQSELRLGGPAYEAAALDQESERTLRNYTIPVTLITMVIGWWCFRSLQLLIAVGIASAYSRFMTMALVYYTGSHLSAVLIVAPILVYVLTVSGAVHLVNYYRDAVRQSGIEGAGWRAVQLGWQPCVFAALTTSLGLGSLAVSQIAPIREFGYYAAACLLISVVVMLTFVPSALELWVQLWRRRDGSPPAGGLTNSAWLSERLPDFILRRHAVVLLVCCLVVAVAAAGLSRIRTTVEFDKMFRPEAEIIRNYTWIEEHLGPLGSLEVVVRFDDECQLNMLQRARLVASMDRSTRGVAGVESTVSAATFLPALPDSGGVRNVIRETIIRRRLESQRGTLEREQLLAKGDNAEFWRITARVPTLRQTDLAGRARRVLDSVDANLAADQPATAHVSTSYTGLLPMVETAQKLLLGDLVKSFGLAVLLICPLMMLILRGVRAGLLAMIPNVVPVALVFGGMGWLGHEVDIGSVLTASVALGIAVDDTLHFLQWFTRGIRQGLTRQDAIRDAFRRCAAAMVQTTLLCGLGLLILSQSPFVPTQRFAVLLFLLLCAALFGDLLLLPTILAGPLGKYFVKRQTVAAG